MQMNHKQRNESRGHKMRRRHKMIFHLGVIGAIVWSLMTEGAKVADILFVLLSVLIEVGG